MLCTNVAHKYRNHSASVASVFEHLIKTRICVSERASRAEVGKTGRAGKGPVVQSTQWESFAKMQKIKGSP